MPSQPLPDPRATDVVRPRGGWHWREWGAECLGTAVLLLGGLSAVCLNFGTGSPVSQVLPSPSLRLLLTGILFAGTGSLVAIMPFGRLSGAHLNPVVTLSFWTQGKVHPHDLVGYIAGQLVGGLMGAGLLLLLWGQTARSVRVGATAPGPGVSPLMAVGLEAGMTAVLVLTILLMTSSARTARWTPLVLWPVITMLVWQGAPFTGTSLNPARSLGPAVLAPLLEPLPIYLVGPLLGGAVGTGLFSLLRSRKTLTAKVFHDARYPGTLGHSRVMPGGIRSSCSQGPRGRSRPCPGGRP